MAARRQNKQSRRGRTNTAQARLDETRGVFMISVAAELAEMHPQTLRMYEQRGLIAPKRSPKGTRLYSQADVIQLRKIQQEMERRLEEVRRSYRAEIVRYEAPGTSLVEVRRARRPQTGGR